MRAINEIIAELQSHPDYMVSEIFTWEGYLNWVNDDYLDNGYTDPIQKSELSKELIDEILSHIKSSIDYVHSPYLLFSRNEVTGAIETTFE
jgi:hypothetical protein